MVATCSAPECHERAVAGGCITFHSFPSDEKRRKEWEKALGRENFKANNASKVCSKHFKPECFERERFGGTWLKAGSIPTIFDFSEHAIKIETPKPPLPITDPNEPTSSRDACNRVYIRRKRKWFLGDFVKEDMNSPENALRVLELANEEHTMKTAAIKKLQRENLRLNERVDALQKLLLDNQHLVTESAQSILGSSETVVKEEQDHTSIEPIVKVKEEPADDYPNPSTSKDTANEEFILPREDNSCTTSDSVVEPQFTLSVAVLAPPNESENCYSEQLTKKQRTNAPDTPSLASASKNTEIGLQSHNPEDISNPGSSKEHSKDQFDAFGNYVAAKLKSLDQVSAACAQKAIGNIIVEAEMGKYRGDTQEYKVFNCAS